MKGKTILLIFLSVLIVLATMGSAFADIEDDFNRSDNTSLGTATNGNTWAETECDILTYEIVSNNFKSVSNGLSTATCNNYADIVINNSDPTRIDFFDLEISSMDNKNIILGVSPFGVSDIAIQLQVGRSSSSDILAYYSGSWLTSNYVVTAGVSFDLSLRNINYVSDTFDIYIDDVLKKTGAAFRSNAGISGVSVNHVSSNGVDVGSIIFDCLTTDGDSCDTTPTSTSNFSTIETGSFSFDTPVVIGSTWGIINSVEGTSENDEVPFYFSSSFTTYGSENQNSDATCRITVDGIEQVNSSRTINTGTYGNFKLITQPLNLSLGNHTVNTECIKNSVKGYTINNSQMTFVHLYDSNENSSVEWLSLKDTTGFGVTTTDTLLTSFSFTTTNTTNTTNLNDIIVHGRASYSYDQDSDITSYLKIQETGEVCGNYTRGGSLGDVGSLGTMCLFKDLNSSTTYNFSYYGYTSVGTGDIIDLLMNVYELKINETASSNEVLSYSVPNGTETIVSTVNISNVLGGTYNVFVDASIMVNSNITQEAYFYINNSESSISYYRTLSNDGSNGNINTQFVFSEGGTGVQSYDLVAYCPSGCEIAQGDFTAFITDSEEVSTGEFTVTAYNAYNNTAINTFNVTVGGTLFSTSNGSVTVISQENINVLVQANNFFSNTTYHDTTTDFNASMTKHVEITAEQYNGGSVLNFTVNTSTDSYTTTNGVAYLPVSNTNTSVTINGETISLQTDLLNKTQTYSFTVYAENSLLITFKDSITDTVVNNVSMDYFSSLDSAQTNTTNGTLYLTLLNPVAYTFRINSSGYQDNLFFTTITDDTFSELTIYLNPNATATTITVEIVDGGASPVANSQVKALKYYVSDNTYRVVASGVTNPDGETKIDLVTETNFYKFIVVVDGVVVKTTDPFIITDTTIRIQVLIGETVLEDYDEWRSISSSLTFNKVTNNFRFDFTDGNSVNREMCMSTYKKGFSTDTLLNTTCVTGTSGTILQGVTNTTGSTYYSKVTTTINGVTFIIGYETVSFPNISLGSGGLLAQILLTLVVSLSGFIAIELIFLMAPLSIVFGGLAGLHSISLGVTIPLVIVGVILMFMLRRNN